MNQRAQQLIRMEQQFETRRTELLRRLGEARAMTGERKLDALADVLQQVLLEQEQVNQYLIAMRTAWTGDMSPEETTDAEPGQMRRPDDGTPIPQPNTSPRIRR